MAPVQVVLEFVVSSPQVLDEGVTSDHDAGCPVPFEASHRSEPGFEPSVASLDPVVGVLGGVVKCSRRKVRDHADQGVGPVGGDLGRRAVRENRVIEELRGGLEVSPLGHEHVDDLPVLVNGAVDVSPGPRHLHVGLVDKPVITHPVAARPGSVDVQWGEPLDPTEQGHVVDLDTAFSEQLLQIPAGESLAQVPAHRDQDDPWWEPEPSEG
jgi:hypothetical protein